MDVDERIEHWKQRAQTNEGMAECMHLLRADLIEAGIINASVPPMFMSEAIIPWFLEMKDKADKWDAHMHKTSNSRMHSCDIPGCAVCDPTYGL